jgi:hypothetical protein
MKKHMGQEMDMVVPESGRQHLAPGVDLAIAARDCQLSLPTDRLDEPIPNEHDRLIDGIGLRIGI